MAKITDVDSEGFVTDTGESLSTEDFCFVAFPRAEYRKAKISGWFMAFDAGFKEMSMDKELRGIPQAVFLYLMGSMAFENFVAIEQKEICEKLQLEKAQSSKAFKTLVEKGLLIKGPKIGRSGSYKINFNYAWRGKSNNLKKAKKTARKTHLTVAK